MSSRTILTIQGMHCASCKALIEEVCQELPNVLSCTADFVAGKAIVEHEGSVDEEQLRKEIEGLGEYRVLEITHDLVHNGESIPSHLISREGSTLWEHRSA